MGSLLDTRDDPIFHSKFDSKSNTPSIYLGVKFVLEPQYLITKDNIHSKLS